ncbi:hypothetical protein [Zoogloea sp. LCSB751]|uniref:hypothetical protein n=1 Tax=Zoogloea sp. LCSB751 TaxID=1965277 RepID=UPI0011170A87|nr:hypothetical protein [Zoogloea sp. LCSB751]
MNYRTLLYGGLAALLTLSVPSHAATPCQAGPPAGASVLHGDFDGDGTADRLWVRRQSRAAIPALAWDPWNARLRRNAGVPFMLVLDRRDACTLIQNRRFFSTPIWNEGPPPLQILPQDAPQAESWRTFAPRWRGDGILLGSEAGIDILLYWDGRRFRVVHSNETP